MFWQRFFYAFFFLSFLFNTSHAAQKARQGAPKPLLKESSSLVMACDTGDLFYAHKIHDKRYPASLTKMMTLYLLFEALEKKRVRLNTKMSVSYKAASQPPCRIGLKKGQKIRVDDALMALLAKSANDVAVVVAEHLGKTEAAFARMMTRKAKALGLRKTVFINASGLPNARQVTTAYDMALLGKALYARFPTYYHFFKTKAFWYQGQKYKNHNRLLGVVEGVDGIKTGYISASGYHLVASAKRDGRRLMAVVMGGRTIKERDHKMTHLLETSFQTLEKRHHLFLASLKPHRKPRDFIRKVSYKTPLRPQKNLKSQAPSRKKKPLQDETKVTVSMVPVTSVALLKKDLESLKNQQQFGFLKALEKKITLVYKQKNQRLTPHGFRFKGLTYTQAKRLCRHEKIRQHGCILKPVS